MNNWILGSFLTILILSHWCDSEQVGRVRWQNLRVVKPQSLIRSRNVFPNSRRFRHVRSQRPERRRIGRPRPRSHPAIRRRSIRPLRRPLLRKLRLGSTRRIMTRRRPRPRKLFGQAFPSTNGLLKGVQPGTPEIHQPGPAIGPPPISRPFLHEPPQREPPQVEYDHYNYDIDESKDYNQDFQFEEDKEFDDFDSFFDDLLGVTDKPEDSKGKRQQSKLPQDKKSPFTILETDFEADDYNAAEIDFHEFDDIDYYDELALDDDKTKKNKKNQKPASDFGFGLEDYNEYGNDEYDEYDEPKYLPALDFEPEFAHKPVNFIKPTFFQPPSPDDYYKVPHGRPHETNHHDNSFVNRPHEQTPYYPDIFKFNHHPDHFAMNHHRPPKHNFNQLESNHLHPQGFHPNHRPPRPNHFEANLHQLGPKPHKEQRPEHLEPNHPHGFKIPEIENHMILPQGFDPNHFNPPVKGFRPPVKKLNTKHEALPEQQFDHHSDEYSNEDDYQNPQDQSDDYGQKIPHHDVTEKPIHEVQNHITEHDEPEYQNIAPPNSHPLLPQLPQFPGVSPFGFTPTPIILEGRPPSDDHQLNDVQENAFGFKGQASPAGSSEGCHTDKGVFHFPGRKWPLEGECGQGVCSRSLAGGWEVWEQRCEGSIQNPQYACVVETKSHLPFPKCCPQPTECRDKV